MFRQRSKGEVVLCVEALLDVHVPLKRPGHTGHDVEVEAHEQGGNVRRGQRGGEAGKSVEIGESRASRGRARTLVTTMVTAIYDQEVEVRNNDPTTGWQDRGREAGRDGKT